MDIRQILLLAIVLIATAALGFTLFITGAASKAAQLRRLRNGLWIGLGPLMVAVITAFTTLPSRVDADEDPRPLVPEPSVRITSPIGVAPSCVKVSGVIANWSDDYKLAIGIREATDSRWWFEGITSIDRNRDVFSAIVQLGSVDDALHGRYLIVPVLVPKSWHRYLLTSTPERGATYWSSLDLPPDSIQGKEIEVRRTSNQAC